MDWQAVAPPGERAAGAGRAAHHCGRRLLHRVCQQHGHHHHLSACPGGAGEGPGVLGALCIGVGGKHPSLTQVQKSLPGSWELHWGPQWSFAFVQNG